MNDLTVMFGEMILVAIITAGVNLLVSYSLIIPKLNSKIEEINYSNIASLKTRFYLDFIEDIAELENIEDDIEYQEQFKALVIKKSSSFRYLASNSVAEAYLKYETYLRDGEIDLDADSKLYENLVNEIRNELHLDPLTFNGNRK